jgi:predicted RecA/RadA family phage recombinase
MAKYLIQEDGTRIVAAASHPAAGETGVPVRLGKLTGVALTDEAEGGNASGQQTIDVGQRVWDLVVDDNEGSGIAVGAIIYYHDTGTGTGSVNLNNSSGSADATFGIALETVAANATTRIKVLHIPSTS